MSAGAERGKARPYTSDGSQELRQLIWGETLGAAVVAGALVMDDWARAPTANARRAVVYFILIIGSRDASKRGRSSQV